MVSDPGAERVGSPLPLRYRVPNPPSDFVGREAELGRLSAVLEAGPTCLVRGEAGIGKTTLVAQLLHRNHEKQLGRVLYIALPQTQPPEDVRLVLGRALFRVQKLEDARFASAASDPEALAAVALDLAETSGLWVFLDDLERADSESARSLIALVTRYAQRSKWICASQAAVVMSELAGRVLELGPMSRAELIQLARRRAPDRDSAELERIVDHAQGLPWQLLTRLSALQAGVDPDAGSAKGLSSGALDLLAVWSRVEEPLPLSVVRGISDEVAGYVDELSGTGVLETSDERAVVHPAARELIAVPERNTELALSLAKSLAVRSEPEFAVTALRIFLSAHKPAEAAATLEQDGRELLTRGFARALWRLLEPVQDPALAVWRLRSAVEGASTEELAKLDRPSQLADSDRLLWARVLFSRARIADAGREALRTLEWAQEHGDERLAFDAGYFLGACLGNQSRWDEAVRALDVVTPPDANATARRDVLAARCLALAGRAKEALARTESVRAQFGALSELFRSETAYAIAIILYELGRTTDVARILQTVDPAQGGTPPSLYTEQGRYALVQGARLSLERARLDECREALALLWPFVGRLSMLRPHMLLTEASCQLFAGELAGLEASFTDVVERARQIGSTNLECVATIGLTRLHVARGSAPAALSGTAEALEECGLNGWILRAHRARAGLRVGRPLPKELCPPKARAAFFKLDVLVSEVESEALLLGGEVAQALARAEQALERAREKDLGLARASLAELRCSILTVLGWRSEQAGAARELGELADEMPSARTLASAQFFASLVRGEDPDVAVLLSVAARPDVCPVAARRARALLSLPAELDALDVEVVGAARRLQRFSAVDRCDALGPDPDLARAFVLSEPRMEVVLPGGRRVDLSRRELLWRLLWAVAQARQEVGKEELVLGVWGERVYHPLRHDNRLQAAARKLRVLLEDDPSNPRRFVTTSEGYALGEPAWRISAEGRG